MEEATPQFTVVKLTKIWQLKDLGSGSKGGITRSRLWLNQTPDGWKITGEQDLK
jgi:hypothetical protein